jgi:RimJ/RimL family protein N-acetyltransferase
MRDEEINGSHVVLVRLAGEDADDLAGLLEDPVIRGFLGVAELTGLRRRFASWESRSAPHGGEWWLNWIVRARDDRRALGWVQATVKGARASVAWSLLPAERGRGAASDSVRAMTAWLRAALDVDEVTASIAPENTASERVARAAGFALTDRRAEDERVWVQPGSAAAGGPAQPEPGAGGGAAAGA